MFRPALLASPAVLAMVGVAVMARAQGAAATPAGNETTAGAPAAGPPAAEAAPAEGAPAALGVVPSAATSAPAGAEAPPPPASPPASPASPPPSIASEPAPAQVAAPPLAESTPGSEDHERFRHSWLTWENAVSSQTIGVGEKYLSENPTYTMSLSFQPRYYAYDGVVDALYFDGRIDLFREFTNSDVTTRRGETSFTDASVVLAYARMLHRTSDTATFVSVRAPTTTFPTSKFSADNGTILGLGTELRLAEEFQLGGASAPLFQRAIVRVAASYNHTFTRATTPTNEALHRVRLDTDGHTVPGDQLTGVAFPEHELAFRGRGFVDVLDRLALWFEVSFQPTWKYGFANVDVCPVLTGCAPASHVEAPTRYVPVTAFQTELMFELLPEVGLSLGYVNVAQQLAPDGQRRSLFWSPGAQFYLDVTGYLDAIYDAASGHRGAYSQGHHLAL